MSLHFGKSIEHVIEGSEDIFGRDPFSEKILSLFANIEKPIVAALDEKWGTGKTVFAKRLEQKAKEKGFSVVYFDAFKRDYEPDVFVSFVAEILASTEYKDSEPKTDLKIKTAKVAKITGKVLSKVGVRFLTAGIVSLGDLAESGHELASALAETVNGELDALIEARLSSARENEATFESFRESLAVFAKSCGQEDVDKKYRKLILIIDELDRCRPDYALSILETIKHFFSVPNVHFLIVCDTQQLQASIRKEYGAEIDENTYLEKFIQVRLNFPSDHIGNDYYKISKYISGLLNSECSDNAKRLINMYSLIAYHKNYSLRRIERFVEKFTLSVAFSQQLNNSTDMLLLTLLCDIHVANNNLYRDLKNGDYLFLDIQKHFSLSSSEHHKNEIDIINDAVEFYFSNNANYDQEKFKIFYPSGHYVDSNTVRARVYSAITQTIDTISVY